jgi:hypothetical protein
MSFDAFIEAAWNDHADRPEEVADRLANSLALIAAPGDLSPYARLVAHVFGEHLGRWADGIALVESLRKLPSFDGSASVNGALARGVAMLRYAAGEGAALEGLSAEDRIAVLATASSALVGRHQFKRAVAAYAEAVELAAAGLRPVSPAVRALAVGGNNLAAALEEKKDRDAAETAGMVAAAEGGLKYWKLAGTWLEEERAEYRLARSRLQAGDAIGAIRSSMHGIEICSKNNAPPFEQFFGHAILAIAQRAAGEIAAFEASRRQALQHYERVDPGEKQWCQSDLEELGSSNPN